MEFSSQKQLKMTGPILLAVSLALTCGIAWVPATAVAGAIAGDASVDSHAVGASKGSAPDASSSASWENLFDGNEDFYSSHARFPRWTQQQAHGVEVAAKKAHEHNPERRLTRDQVIIEGGNPIHVLNSEKLRRRALLEDTAPTELAEFGGCGTQVTGGIMSVELTCQQRNVLHCYSQLQTIAM